MTQAMDTAFAALMISSLRALFLAGIAGIGLAISGTKATTVRLFVWRAVLVSALAIPFLGQVLPPLRIPTPEFLRSADIRPIKQPTHDSWPMLSITDRLQTSEAESRSIATIPGSTVTLSPSTQPRSAFGLYIDLPSIPWNSLPVAIYLIVATIFLIRLIAGVALTQRLICASQTIADPRLHQMLDSHVPVDDSQVRESSVISVPVTVGAFRSAILLPLGWRQWDDSKLNAVMAHELSHVSRRDALVQFVSFLHRAIFWFSPLAWWLDRRLATLAEEASDEAALSRGADRNDYARTLVEFFEALQTAPGRIWWQGVSMARHGQAEQRVENILAFKGSINMKESLVVALIIFSVPAVYLVASVRPTSNTVSSTQQSQAPSIVPDTASAPVDGMSSTGPADVGPAAPSMPTASAASVSASGPVSSAGTAPTASVAPVASYAAQSDGHGYSYAYGRGYSNAYGDDDEDRFIIVSGKSDSLTMSGSTQDIHHVQRLKKQIPGDFIWFQRDEKSYIIRDQATIDRAKAFWAPQEELGKKQEALGKQQEALGKQQEALGKKMEQVRVNVPSDLTAKLDALKARLQKLGPSATMEEIGDLQSEIGELQGQIGDIQGRAGEQQGKLGEEQGKLGEQQGKLGEEQGKLGEEQGRLAEEAVKKTKALFDECIKNGKAKPESDGSQGASL